jgi:D-beta-D-heptose 7-phosphate kinase/D-beta-D-heptose 1-phosphate adenosyltransferase
MTDLRMAIAGFDTITALVLGDMVLDTYHEGTADRLCSEGPVPVVRKVATHHAPGGAANTAANLRALGAQVRLVSRVGNDSAARQLQRFCHDAAIDSTGVVIDPAWATPQKIRILADGHYVVRFDDEAGATVEGAIIGRLIAALETAYPACDIVVISDYGYGVASGAVLARLGELARQHPKPILVDSKHLLALRDLPLVAVTPNLHEVCEVLALDLPERQSAMTLSIAAIAELGRRLLARMRTHAVVVTLAARGALVVSRDGAQHHLPAHPVVQAHDVGAGDSFTAALSLAVAQGLPLADAVQLGLDAASIAVRKPRTAIVTQRELAQLVQQRALDQPQSEASFDELIATVRERRQAGATIVFTNGIFDELTGDQIVLLQRARALGDLLVVGLNSDASLAQLRGKRRVRHSLAERMLLVRALACVDHVVPFDDADPSDLIRALQPQIYVKGSTYLDAALPESDAVREYGGRTIIITVDRTPPLAPPAVVPDVSSEVSA